MIRYFAWLGTLTSIVGSFLVASTVVLPGFIAFTMGSISWLIVGAIRQDRALITLNAAFLIANILGLYNAMV